MTRGLCQWASSQSKDLVLICRWVKILWKFQATEWHYQSSCGSSIHERGGGGPGRRKSVLGCRLRSGQGHVFSSFTFLLDVSGQGSLISCFCFCFFFWTVFLKDTLSSFEYEELILYCSKPEVWLRDLWAPVSTQGSGKRIVLVKTKQNSLPSHKMDT